MEPPLLKRRAVVVEVLNPASGIPLTFSIMNGDAITVNLTAAVRCPDARVVSIPVTLRARVA